MNSAPCKDCKKRQLHCHDVCERYAAFKEEIDVANRRRKEYEAAMRPSEAYFKAIRGRR